MCELLELNLLSCLASLLIFAIKLGITYLRAAWIPGNVVSCIRMGLFSFGGVLTCLDMSLGWDWRQEGPVRSM